MDSCLIDWRAGEGEPQALESISWKSKVVWVVLECRICAEGLPRQWRSHKGKPLARALLYQPLSEFTANLL